MISQFRKPQQVSQCIIEIKEIKQAPAEMIWDFDQWFRMLMAKVNFQMSGLQHKEWFIAALLPHIRGPLMQQKITMQMEALKLAMKLEASPIGDGATGMIQIQSQLANLTLQLQDMKRRKEAHKDLQCT